MDDRPIRPMKDSEPNIDYISLDKLPTLTAEQLT